MDQKTPGSEESANQTIPPKNQPQLKSRQKDRFNKRSGNRIEQPGKGTRKPPGPPKSQENIWDRLQKHPIYFILAGLIPLMIAYVGFARDIFAFIRPTPPMAGEFNVAIAPFTMLNADGQVISSPDGLKIADFIYRRLKSSLPEIDPDTIQVELRGPEDTDGIRGATAADRYTAAEALATQINAHILIYGIIQDGASPDLYPEFFVSYQGFEQGDEIAGAHQLGSPLRIELPFDETKIQDVENPALSARANALSLIVIGLAYDSIDKSEQAIAYYQKADALPGWLPNAGKEVLYLLMGNAYLRQASMKKDPSFVPLADEAYDRALEIDPDYLRALMGKGGVAYLKALGDPNDENAASISLGGLQEAEDYFQTVLNAGSLPESMNIPPKVHFNLGQIYLVRGQVQDPQWWETAQAEFNEVLSEYKSGVERIHEMASQAYARSALIYRLQGNPEAAIEYYDEAIASASPYYKALYMSRKAEVYVDQGQVNQAIAALEEAIREAEFYAYPELVTQFNSRINELR